MHRKTLISIFTFIILASFVCLAQAEMTKEKFKHVDKNKDGTIDSKEMHMEKQWEKSQNKKVNTWWEKRADTNGDGVVSSGELASWKELEKKRIDLNGDGEIDAKERRLCWRHACSRVNTNLEKKYDVNGDGWMEPSEVKEMLKDKYTLIQTKGKAKVDTDIEEEYDTNNDGVIDASEAKSLKEDLEEK